ncbi:hypothetical protein TUN199_10727 [Pyrenophora tritici-repentis]|uniref:Uncharacterized protein n=1 Tax=Pyrenophora tritici-repentis TaxID=45151 RepID=A0A5M9KTU5_9PLEO|nr:hypothetical protein PtrV1_12687 [Pyrenophora tritici-repentis]KAF7445500.1 hypothetical protein A1F99_104860 [Pyrenophora tritici-repentis]KAF7565781.1 hypothetical protein PtrM4_052150 [Pyrenophora tritici-repentis]KAI0577532.1 hypothetical protein Alg130_08334 [Pyrenophora tritici-repentis]KAI0583560.1 hypothetical protein Alg215_03527 [Pyrenophora tritici-repentis]
MIIINNLASCSIFNAVKHQKHKNVNTAKLNIQPSEC